MQRKLARDNRRNRTVLGSKVLSAVVLACVAFGVLFSSSAAAQETAEISGNFGYTFSEGFETEPGTFISELIDKVNPASGYSLALRGDFFVSEQSQVGFMWSQQDSTLELDTAIGKRNVTGMKVNNYHGVFTYNWGYSDSAVRPFFYGGLGATQSTFDEFMGFDIESGTKFSTTWGGGVKVYPTPRFGINFTARWTPTYIKSDPGGTYCSPYWNPWYPGGCVILGDPDYANQFDLSAGISVRF